MAARRPLQRLAMLVVLGLLTTGAGPCGGDKANGTGGGAPDAPPADDASPASDGSVSDTPIASAGQVTVIVMSGGAPVRGVHTYFLNPGGSLAVAVDTDASGTAIGFVGLGTFNGGPSVTVVNPFADESSSGFDQLRTIMGVRPGDRIVVTETGARIDVAVKAPVTPGADSYAAHTTCGDGDLHGSTVATGTLSLGCSPTDILVVASHGATPIKSLYHPGVTANGTIDLTGDSYQDIGSLAFSYTNLPAAATAADVAAASVTTYGFLDDHIDAPATVANGTASGTLAIPTMPPTGAVRGAFLLAATHFVVDIAPVTASYALDLGNVLLPDIAQRPSYDVANRRVVWVEAAGGAAPDLTWTQLDVTRPAGASTPQRRWRWRLIAPYTRGQVAFPLSSVDLTPWVPLPIDTVSVQMMNEKLPGGYDAVRARFFDDAGLQQVISTGRSVVVGSSSM